MKVELKENSWLPEIQALYERSFPASEKKPFEVIQRCVKNKTASIYAITAGEAFAGLLITLNHAPDFLIDYLAIEPALQSHGIGSAALQLYIQNHPQDRVVIEIEAFAFDQPASLKTRRYRFYEKNGFVLMPYQVLLFGEEMNILVWKNSISFEQYLQIYEYALGEKVLDYIKEKK